MDYLAQKHMEDSNYYTGMLEKALDWDIAHPDNRVSPMWACDYKEVRHKDIAAILGWPEPLPMSKFPQKQDRVRDRYLDELE